MGAQEDGATHNDHVSGPLPFDTLDNTSPRRRCHYPYPTRKNSAGLIQLSWTCPYAQPLWNHVRIPAFPCVGFDCWESTIDFGNTGPQHGTRHLCSGSPPLPFHILPSSPDPIPQLAQLFP